MVEHCPFPAPTLPGCPMQELACLPGFQAWWQLLERRELLNTAAAEVGQRDEMGQRDEAAGTRTCALVARRATSGQ